jgi:hypothetical protein
MRLCDLTVRLNDSTGHTVHKQDVTPAEIVVLQQIHGNSAVVDIVPKTEIKRTQAEEWERLQGIYGRNPDGLMDAGNGDLLEKLFPGAISSKRLPVTMQDIGLGHLTNPLRGKGKIAKVEPEPELVEPKPELEPEDEDDGEAIDSDNEGAS